MSLEPPYPSTGELMCLMGEVGKRIAQIAAGEGSAGNISVYMGWKNDPEELFPVTEPYALSRPVPEVGGGSFMVTGSGRRLREVYDEPTANLGYVSISPDGSAATLHTSKNRRFERLTVEFNSHLSVHCDNAARNQGKFGALVHAQPLHLTYLSHIGRYQDERYLNRHILRWQPEGISSMPEGVGFIPFYVPGSQELEIANIEALRTHKIVLWAKHGVMARSATSLKRACDLLEYAETGATYEYLNLTNHGLAEGLSDEQVRSICSAYNIEQSIF